MFPQGGRTERMEGWKEAGGRGRGQSTLEENVYLPLQRTHLNSRNYSVLVSYLSFSFHVQRQDVWQKSADGTSENRQQKNTFKCKSVKLNCLFVTSLIWTRFKMFWPINTKESRVTTSKLFKFDRKPLKQTSVSWFDAQSSDFQRTHHRRCSLNYKYSNPVITVMFCLSQFTGIKCLSIWFSYRMNWPAANERSWSR